MLWAVTNCRYGCEVPYCCCTAEGREETSESITRSKRATRRRRDDKAEVLVSSSGKSRHVVDYYVIVDFAIYNRSANHSTAQNGSWGQRCYLGRVNKAPAVWDSLPSGIRDSSSTHIFVVFLKLTASSRLSAPPSGSPKCLSFGHWLTLCTRNIHLLTYAHGR